MYPDVNTRDPVAVLEAVGEVVGELLGTAEWDEIRRVHGWLQEAFAGRAPAFEALDTHYHDLEHTMQGFLCLARLVAGWVRAEPNAGVDPRMARLGLTSILLHDTGYLKRRGRETGPGARFTLVHVRRGAEFAGEILDGRGWSPTDIAAVQAMVRCTDANAVPGKESFESTSAWRMGCAVGTADLLGQLAAPDYLERLPRLYREFAEAIEAHPGCILERLFPTCEALIRQTPDFWEKNVQPRLDGPLQGMRRFLEEPKGNGTNPYVTRIEAHIARLRGVLGG